jgi:shikimate dehydrogenase
VFGYPVEHSLSPAMHNAAIAALGLHFVYIPFSVKPDDVGAAVQSLPGLGIVGVNLTVPHKERVLPYLDEVHPEARVVGAVNTVQIVDGKLIGHNTDGDGFMEPLNEIGFRAEGARAVVLGAGGAARSVVYRLTSAGASVTIANRTRMRADRLAAEFQALSTNARVRSVDLDMTLRSELQAADLVVNTTSVGMYPDLAAIPLAPLEGIRAGQIVYDLVYRPQETRLLREARERGAEIINGVKMLVRQGAASFRIWTGIEPPVKVMEQAVVERLSNP